jgi:hypothetical protein
MEELVKRAILAGRLVGATNNWAIESGHDDEFESVHSEALRVQTRAQNAIAEFAGWFDLENDHPKEDSPELAALLWDANADERQLMALITITGEPGTYPRLIIETERAAYWEVAEGVYNATPIGRLPANVAGYASLPAIMGQKGEPWATKAPYIQMGRDNRKP